MILKVGDLCFCKKDKTGYFWPGKVIKIVSRGFHVKLFGNGQFSRIGPESVLKVCSETLDRFANNEDVDDVEFRSSMKSMLFEYEETLKKSKYDTVTNTQQITKKAVFMKCINLKKLIHSDNQAPQTGIEKVIPLVSTSSVTLEKTVYLDHINVEDEIVELEEDHNIVDCQNDSTEPGTLDVVQDDGHVEIVKIKSKNDEKEALNRMLDNALEEVKKKMRVDKDDFTDEHSEKRSKTDKPGSP